MGTFSFGTHTLMPLVSRYMRQNPGVDVELILTDRYVDLVEEGFEAVFRTGPLRDSSLAARALRPFRLLACASPGYLDERGTPRRLEDLQAHECLAFVGARSPSTDWTFLLDGREIAVPTSGRLQANNANALLAASLEGIGIAFIAEDLARSALSTGKLVRVLPDFDTLSRPMHLLFQADRRQTTKLRSFIDMVVQDIGQERVDA